jgi:hypothetical protein
VNTFKGQGQVLNGQVFSGIRFRLLISSCTYSLHPSSSAFSQSLTMAEADLHKIKIFSSQCQCFPAPTLMRLPRSRANRAGHQDYDSAWLRIFRAWERWSGAWSLPSLCMTSLVTWHIHKVRWHPESIPNFQRKSNEKRLVNISEPRPPGS